MVSTDVASGRVMMSVCRRQTRVLFGCFCQRRSTQPQPQVTRFRQRGAYLEEHISQLVTTKSSKARALVVTSYAKAKEVDEKHHILSRAKAAPPALG